MIEQIKQLVQPLYDNGSLLGFSVCGEDGTVLHNESFLSNEAAGLATVPFIDVIQQMKDVGRTVNRLTVELDDVILIYGRLEESHALFALGKECDLDAAAEVLS